MSLRYLAPLEILAAVTLAVAVAVQPVAAQARTSASVTGTAGNSTQLRTPWGDPDLQGVWTNTTLTPLERAERVAGREVLTDAEQAELDAQAAHTLERLEGTGAYNDFWLFHREHAQGSTRAGQDRGGKREAMTAESRPHRRRDAIVPAR